jgi:hypothetical protein
LLRFEVSISVITEQREFRARFTKDIILVWCDWLRAGQSRGRSSSPIRVKNVYFSISSRPSLVPIQPHIQWVAGVKRQGLEADHSLPTSAEVKKA